MNHEQTLRAVAAHIASGDREAAEAALDAFADARRDERACWTALGACKLKLEELSTGPDRRVAPREVEGVLEMARRALE